MNWHIPKKKNECRKKTSDLGICNTKNVFNPFTSRGSNDIANCWLKMHFIEEVNLTSHQKGGGQPKIFRIFCQFLRTLSERVACPRNEKDGSRKRKYENRNRESVKREIQRAAIEKIKLSYTDNQTYIMHLCDWKNLFKV